MLRKLQKAFWIVHTPRISSSMPASAAFANSVSARSASATARAWASFNGSRAAVVSCTYACAFWWRPRTGKGAACVTVRTCGNADGARKVALAFASSRSSSQLHQLQRCSLSVRWIQLSGRTRRFWRLQVVNSFACAHAWPWRPSSRPLPGVSPPAFIRTAFPIMPWVRVTRARSDDGELTAAAFRAAAETLMGAEAFSFPPASRASSRP